MTKEERLASVGLPNTPAGVKKFYKWFPDKESHDNYMANGGSLSGAPHNGQPTANEFFSYGSHYNDSVNVPMSNPYYAAEGGTPYYGGPIRPYEPGGISPAGTMSANNNMSVNKKMTPEEWAKHNTDLGYEVAKNYSSSDVKYPGYINPKDYAYDDSGFGGYKKIGDVGKTIDYTKDPTYKPFNEYSYKDPVKVQQQTVKPWTPAGTTPEGYGLFTKNQDPKLGQFIYKEGKYVPSQGRYGGYMAYGGGLPGGANEYDMPCMNCGGYMEQGGDYNSPTNYGSFNVPMAYGGGLPKAQKGKTIYNYTPLSKRDSTNVMRQLEKPEFQPGYSYRVSKNRNNVYQTSPSGQENEYNGWQSNTAKHAALQEYIARQDLAAGKVPSQPPVFADTYNQYRGMVKEDGGILDASNNMSYPTFEDGGKYNLLNLIKAASKKMKKAYGGDTVTQGGNSDNYPQGITDAFKNGIKNNTMNALMNEEQESFSNEIKQMGGYSGGYNNGYNSGNMYNNYNQQPQFDRKNQGMQNMYQQRIDDTQANLKNDSKYFGQSMKYLGATANPYTKTSVKAQTGTQTGSRNMSAEEWAWMDEQRKAKENQANYARYFGSQGTRGMNYIPMNYSPFNKISKKDVGIMKQLADNPSTNLKEFSHRHFGPWSKTKMTFGYKEGNPTENKTDPIQVNLKTQPSFEEQAALDHPLVGPRIDNTSTNTTPTNDDSPTTDAMQGFIPKKIFMDSQLTPKKYGGLSKAQYGKDHMSTNPADDTYDNFGNIMGISSNSGNLGVSSNPITNQGSFTPIGNAPGAVSSSYQGAPQPAFSTPESVGIQQKNTMMKKDGVNKTATITQKGRPGFNGEAMANAMIAGTNMASSFLESGQNAKNEQKLSELRLADNAFVSTPGNAQSRGDYDPNSGMFRPDDMVPVQFAGYGAYGGSFQDGGMQQQQPDPQQVMQGVATMLQQGAQPEQVAKQLVEMGIPQEQVIQIIQAVMQQLQGGQEPQQQPMRYGGFATGGAAEEESYEEDLNEDEIAELRAQGYDVEYI
jgi:hypothetical protein